jgi:hypothetical protein
VRIGITGDRAEMGNLVPFFADAYGKTGQPEAGLQSLSSFDFLDKANGPQRAELHRLKGELANR